jgi:hypothetical protein
MFAGSTVHDIATSDGGPGASVISGHYDKKLRFWDIRSDAAAFEVLLAGKITSLDISLGMCSSTRVSAQSHHIYILQTGCICSAALVMILFV